MIQLLIAYASKAALLLSLATLLTSAMSAAAAVRHSIWITAIAAILLTLPLSLVLPPFHLGLVTAAPAEPVLTVVILAWLVGAGLFLAAMAASCLRLLAVRRSMRRVEDPAILAAAAEAATDLKVARRVGLAYSPGSMPLTFGAFAPVIMIPEGAADWPAARLRISLLHEMAHVARRDALWQALSMLVRAVHWYNPLAWLALRRMKAAAEQACDDLVIAAGAAPGDYARSLIECASASSRDGRREPPGALIMAAVDDLKERIDALWSAPRREPRSRLRRALAVAALSALALSLAPLRGEEFGGYGYASGPSLAN